MSFINIAAAAGAAALFLLQQTPTTLQNVTTHGVKMQVFGLEIPVTYSADGKFVGSPPGQKVEGVWRIDGDKLCTRVNTDPEVCAAYPAGKARGDSFDVPGAMGPTMGVVRVTIR